MEPLGSVPYYKDQPLVPILLQTNSIHTFPPTYLRSIFSIIHVDLLCGLFA
jgi:hypothetical protein